MRKILLYDKEMAEYQDFLDMQTFRLDDVEYVLQSLFEYENVFTDDNFEAVAATPWNVTVQSGTDGKAIINGNIAEKATDTDITIDLPGAADRDDIITASAALTDDATQLRDYIDATGTVITPAATVVSQTWHPTFHYHKGTTVVPAGQTLICTITVPTTASSIADCTITDGRAEKPLNDLTTHRTLATLDHPAGCILNTHINASADIALSKLNGISTGMNGQELITLGVPIAQTINFTYNVDGTINTLGVIASTSSSIQFNYSGGNVSDIVLTAVLASGSTLTYTISFTWVGDQVVTITTNPVVA
jgi:hypothetical protein